MPKIKLDLSQNGLLMVFKDYQAAMIEEIWERKEPIGSKEMWDILLAGGFEVSRASVINSLNWMTEEGILACNEVTGKGGYRGQYTATHNEEEFWSWLANHIRLKLGDASDGWTG